MIQGGEPEVELALLHTIPLKSDLEFLEYMVWDGKGIACKEDCVERLDLKKEEFELWGDDTEDVTNEEEELLRKVAV